MLKIYSNFIGAESFENVIPNDLKNKPITIFNDYANITQEQLEFNPYNILFLPFFLLLLYLFSKILCNV